MTRFAALLSLVLAVPCFGQLVSQERVLSAPISVSGARALPAAVWTGDSFAVFWSDSTGMFAGRVGTNGALLGTPVKLASDEVVGSVAFNGDELLLVTWARRNGKPLILARALTRDLVSNGEPQTIGEGILPRVTWNGAEFVAAWIAGITQPQHWIVVATLGNDAAITSFRYVTSTPAPRPNELSLASTPTETLLVWEDMVGCEVPTVFPCIAGARIRAMRLDANLTSLDPEGIAITPAGYNPEVVANGREYLVVWTDLNALQAQRIDASGARVGGVMTLNPHDHLGSTHVSAASDGREYFVATHETVGIFGARIADAKRGDELTIHSQSNYYEGPVVFAGPPSLYLIAYQRYDERHEFRTFLRTIDLAAPARRRVAR